MKDPTVLALSDLFVLTALQRACARREGITVRHIPLRDRHSAYEQHPVLESKIDTVLADAWALCPLIAGRHHLDIDVARWIGLLDGYTRALLLMGMPHSPQRLRDVLAGTDLSVPAWEDEDQLQAAQ